jgi:metal-responsive CopG/Arc/MetJ family transcriptional regulator
MKRATITIPDELQRELERYLERQENPPELSTVVETALRDFLDRQEESADRDFRPFRITPAKVGSGHSDVSINHDAYIAEDTYKNKLGTP